MEGKDNGTIFIEGKWSMIDMNLSHSLNLYMKANG
jgi:hypothetical protein